MRKREVYADPCSAPNCELIGKTIKGLCLRHYNRMRLYGTFEPRLRIGTGETPEQRFWSRVAITANPYRCWEWQGSLIMGGYGRLNFYGKHWKAHRLAWFLVKGRAPQQFLLHSCDNPKCVNPNHLREGSLQENADDMVERRRSLSGERNPKAKLTAESVIKIKTRLQSGVKPATIAREYNVNHSTIARIKTGKNWIVA